MHGTSYVIDYVSLKHGFGSRQVDLGPEDFTAMAEAAALTDTWLGRPAAYRDIDKTWGSHPYDRG